ncbi:hypothetical protein AHiyo6_31650, partial [Arthrobacter sp. Hiyo6]
VAEPGGVQNFEGMDSLGTGDRLGSLAGNGQGELLVIGVIGALFRRDADLARRRRKRSPAALFLVPPSGGIVRRRRPAMAATACTSVMC